MLTVKADQDVTRYDRNPVKKGAFLDFGKSEKKGDFNAQRDIVWDSTVNLPGSPKAAVENLAAVWPAVSHCVAKAQGDQAPCGGS